MENGTRLCPNRQSMTIGDQFVLMFHDEVTPQIHLAMGSKDHPCSTIHGSMRHLSLMRPAVVLLPLWTNNHYPMPGLNVVINLYKLACLPTPSIDKAFQKTIGNNHNRPHHRLF